MIVYLFIWYGYISLVYGIFKRFISLNLDYIIKNKIGMFYIFYKSNFNLCLLKYFFGLVFELYIYKIIEIENEL